MRFPIYIKGGIKDVKAKALLDSSASGLFIHWDFVKKHCIPTRTYSHPRTIRNVDHSLNVLGKITNFVETTIKIGDHKEVTRLSVTDIKEDDLIPIGLPWLQKHNPDMDWTRGHMVLNRCPMSCQVTMRKKRRQTRKL